VSSITSLFLHSLSITLTHSLSPHS
jgi:hypothetical protein